MIVHCNNFSARPPVSSSISYIFLKQVSDLINLLLKNQRELPVTYCNANLSSKDWMKFLHNASPVLIPIFISCFVSVQSKGSNKLDQMLFPAKDHVALLLAALVNPYFLNTSTR